MKDLNIIPKYTLWGLIAWGIIAIAIFFLGGNQAEGLEVAGDILNIPNYTNLFLITNYIYFALVLLVTLFFVIMGFVALAKHDIKKALTALGIVLAIVLLFVICWFLGSPEKINIIGYDGTDNEGFWAQLSDMMIYMTYILLVATLGVIAWGAVYTRIKK